MLTMCLCGRKRRKLSEAKSRKRSDSGTEDGSSQANIKIIVETYVNYVSMWFKNRSWAKRNPENEVIREPKTEVAEPI